jgi:transcriptional pleiotropic regulator of transition state genes
MPLKSFDKPTDRWYMKWRDEELCTNGSCAVMKATGIVRRVDELGRVVLPVELRRTLDISDRDALEIFTDDECIVLRKYQPDCIFCGSMENIQQHKGKPVCARCLTEMGSKAQVAR